MFFLSFIKHHIVAMFRLYVGCHNSFAECSSHSIAYRPVLKAQKLKPFSIDLNANVAVKNSLS